MSETPRDCAPASGDDPEFHRQVVDLALDGVTLVDEHAVIVYENGAVEALLGHPLRERLGRSVLEHVHPEDRGRAEQALARLLGGEAETQAVEVRLLSRDGVWRDVEAVGRRWVRDGRVHVLFNSRDVSRTRHTIEALGRSNELLSKILRSSRNIVSLTRAATGEFVEVNDEWLRVSGYRRDEVIGRTALELGIWGDEANRERVMTAVREADGRLRDYEILTYPRSGARRFLINVETLEDQGETLVLMIGTDVTESREVEEQLRQSQKMEAVGQLTGGVAHDFNNLLSVVMGNADLLRLALADRPELVGRVDTILQAAEHGAALTRQLLAFSRRQALEPSAVRVERMVAETLPLLSSTLPASVAVDVRADQTVPHVLVDAAQLENALLNLVLNARDAMPDGGRLTIAVERRRVAAGSIVDLSPGDYVALTVADTGRGMDAEVRRRAFDPFFTTKAVGQGTGLGLSMVFGFVTQSGGSMDMDSEPGVGTRMTMLLPAADPAALER